LDIRLVVLTVTLIVLIDLLLKIDRI